MDIALITLPDFQQCYMGHASTRPLSPDGHLCQGRGILGKALERWQHYSLYSLNISFSTSDSLLAGCSLECTPPTTTAT